MSFIVLGLHPTAIRYCPLCMVEEKQRLGEYFLHRSLQIPFVTSCPLHGAVLREVYYTERGQYTTGSLPSPAFRYDAACL
jgi:hypothetical protein